MLATILIDALTAIGAAGTLVAAILAFKQYQAGRLGKSISFRTAALDVVTVRPDVEGRIEVLFDGKVVPAVSLVTVMIKCSGKGSITESDTVRPLSVNFGDGATLLAAKVEHTKPDSLDVELGEEDTRVLIKPLLLNEGDEIEISALVAGPPNRPRLDSRVVGVPKFRDLAEEPELSVRSQLAKFATSAVPFVVLLFVALYLIGLFVGSLSEYEI